MGRGLKQIDLDVGLDLILRGESIARVATELGVSPPTLRARIAELQKEQGVLLQYRAVQSLQLTSLQARVLEAITPEKIDAAPLRDLVMSYKILKDKELVIEGKPSEIKGLVAHLIYLEKQEQALLSGEAIPVEEEPDSIDVPASSESTPGDPDTIVSSSLAEIDDSKF